MKNKLLIYPFTQEYSSLVRYKHLLLDYNEVFPISPKAIGLNQKDISELDGGDILNIKIESSILDKIDICDAILIIFNDTVISEKEYLSLIKLGLSKNKKIYVTSDIEKTSNFYNQKDIFSLKNENIENLSFYSDSLLEIPVPVILIVGDGDNCGKFDLQLSLREKLSDEGYKVGQIGTKKFSKLFGFDAMPSFMFEPMLLKDKILKFNNYIYDFVLNSNPDVLVLSSPGGLMPISNKNLSEFGEFAYVIANSVIPDVLIRSIYTNSFSEKFILEDKKFCLYNLRIEPNYYVVSNMAIVIEPNSHMEIDYIPKAAQIHNNMIDGMKYYALGNIHSLAVDIINELSSNLEII